MKPHTLLSALWVVLGLVSMPIAADAQQPNKLPRVGWLGNCPETTPVYGGFRQALRELGYLKSKNIILIGRFADGSLDESQRKIAGRRRLAGWSA
jgi:hypothetical protein